MSDPREILAQLLSESQADVLAKGAAGIWESVASGLGAISGSAPTIQELDARLVMPDEIAGEFADGHIVTPLNLSTDHDQAATAYVVINTDIGAMFLDSQADEPGDQEQQTMVMASAMLSQIVSGINASIFADSPNGLVVAMDEMSANSMPMLLGTMEEPGLLLTASIQGERVLPLSLLLPGTFLDILSVSFPEDGAGAGGKTATEPVADVSAVAESEEAAAPSDEPFTFNMEDLQDVQEAAAAVPVEEHVASGEPAATAPVPEPAAPAAAPRQPTPISQAAVHRATFTPFEQKDSSGHQSNLDLLSGLDMHVTVELGRTDMTIAEVLAIGAGSVIELDRLAGEPVDILVNDRIVAHGEVVVMEENFGVRVTEVVKPNVDAGQAV